MNTASFAVDGTIQGRVGSNAFVNYDQTDLIPYKYFPTSSYHALTPSQNGSIYGKAIYGVDKYSIKAKCVLGSVNYVNRVNICLSI